MSVASALEDEWPNPLRVWWVPQVPMKSYYREVKTPREAILVCEVLSEYDNFQFHNQVKPDYTNAGGIQEFMNGEWWDVDHPFDDNFWEGWN